jgi:hypothetical protein
MNHQFKVGDPVIYQRTKRSTHPGPRAEKIYADPHGETYTYIVDKFWRVKQVMDGGKLLLYTRRGKEHICHSTDRNLKRAGWITRLVRHNRFPDLGGNDLPDGKTANN